MPVPELLLVAPVAIMGLFFVFRLRKNTRRRPHPNARAAKLAAAARAAM